MEVSMKYPEFKNLPEEDLSHYMTYLFCIYSALSELFYIIYLYPCYPFHSKDLFTCQVPVNTWDENSWIVGMFFLKPFCIACLQGKIHLPFYGYGKFLHHAHRVINLTLLYVFYNEFCKILKDGYIIVYCCLYVRSLHLYYHIFSIHGNCPVYLCNGCSSNGLFIYVLEQFFYRFFKFIFYHPDHIRERKWRDFILQL